MAEGGSYSQHPDDVERAIALVAGRRHLSREDAEDFASTVRVHLLGDDGAVVRQYRGQAALFSYLTVVVSRLFLDWRNAQWGKWRCSAEAQRLGPVAVRLEELLVRDGLSMDEAVETLRTNERIADTRSTLEDMAARFPVRPRRRHIEGTDLVHHAAPDPAPGTALDAEAAAKTAARVSRALDDALGRLDVEMRLIIQLWCEERLTIAALARQFRRDQRLLYRQLDHVKNDLRTALEGAGISATDARSVLAHRGFDLAELGNDQPEMSGRVRLFEWRPGKRTREERGVRSEE